MAKIKNSFIVLLYSLVLLNMGVFFAFPYEGGAVLIGLAVLWFVLIYFRRSTIMLSKGTGIAIVFGLYTLLMKPFSYQIPANDYTIFQVFLFVWFMIMVDATLDKEKTPTSWENSLIISALAISLLELIEIVSHYQNRLSTIAQLTLLRNLTINFRLSGILFIHPNVLAGFLNLVWPIVFIRLVKAEKKTEKGLWLLALLLFGLMFYYTISRGALVGAILGVLFLAYRYFYPHFSYAIKRTTNTARKLRYPLLPVAIGGGFIILLLLGVIGRAIQSGQFSLSGLQGNRWITILDSLSSGRGSLWQDAWDAFLQKPWFGHGNGGFLIAYVQAAQLPPGFLATSAHNLWLNTMVEYGVTGLAGFLVVLIIMILKAVQYVYDMKDKSLRFSDAYLASGLAFLGQHVFDSMLWVSNYLAFLLVISLFLIRYTLRVKDWLIGRKTFFFGGIFCLLAVSLSYFSMISKIAPSQSYMSAFTPSNSNAIESELCALADRYPQNALYHFECSRALVEQLFSASSPSNLEEAARAIEYQQRGLALDPHWPPQQANLAGIYWIKGERLLAVEQMRQAAYRTPYNALLWLNYGWMEEQINDQQKALEAYERVVRLNPLLIDSTFNQFSSLFSLTSQQLKEWLEAEEEWDSWYSYEIVDTDFHKAVILLGLGEIQSALSSFQASADRFPRKWPSYYAYLSYALQKNNQKDLAAQYAYELAFLDRNQLAKIEDALLLSLIGSVLQSTDQSELAYYCFMNSYLIQTQPTERMYYLTVYRQPILQTDISPLLIRNLSILQETRPAWEWFVNEARYREPAQVADEIALWYQSIDGMAGIANRD